MASFFGFGGKKLTVKETAKKGKREITRGQRQLDRERAGLEREERKLKAEIKKAAKAGRKSQLRILAKDLVRIRKSKDKLLQMRCNMGAMKTRTTTMAATATIANSMKNTTKTMKAMNKQMDVGKMQDQMAEFMRVNAQMEPVHQK